MKFYDRETEQLELERLWDQTDSKSNLVVVTGRRRLGKTLLVTQFAKPFTHFYFFAKKKPEALLCQEFLAILRERLPFPVLGEITRFKDILILLFEYAKKEKIIVILDEFQEFFTINPSVYSEMQNLWDKYKFTAKMLFIAIGSVYSLMYKIFENEKEPLFRRADRIMKLTPFSIPMIAKVLLDHQVIGDRNLFDFYVTTGGVPKYLDFLMTSRVKNLQGILDFMLAEFSPFLEEGRHLLTLEFGKESGIYFSVLELLSAGRTSRSEIESILGFGVGGYMDRLEKTYGIIYRVVPLNAKPTSLRIKFAIKDPFLQFWFRFIYRNWSAIELKNFGYVREIIERDYSTYCGRLLERFFLELIALTKKYNRIGPYWEQKNSNEIDIVAINDLERKLFIAEVKIDPKKFNLYELQHKAQNLLKLYDGYQVTWANLSLQDVVKFVSL